MRHEWNLPATDDGFPRVLTVAEGEVSGDNPGGLLEISGNCGWEDETLAAEILRLAGRVRELEEVRAKGATYIALLEERVREIEVERDAKEATIHMAVARLGGLVEGQPTHRINFLQRIDALRALEAESAALRENLESAQRGLRLLENRLDGE